MNILVIGQSHVAAIRDAARARREADPDRPRTRVIHTLEPRYAPELVSAGDEARFTDALAAAVRDQIDRHHPRLASVMGGNYHNAIGLLRHPRPFDFLLSDEAGPPPDPDAEPIAEALVRSALAAGLARDFARLTLLRALGGPFIHVESPPPVRDGDWVAARADAWFRERGGPAIAVAPAALRWRLWRLNSRLFREAVEGLGGRFLPVPAETQDADGFLRSDFAADATHGNAAYGEAVIRALESL
ncbi:hypothetical protein [Sphingomonas quercus]|uniref:SGNH/GDSL hydrolase family protein n=1 Tax=Sphingomonas quercus TaxID=2842451 RepID=A0ABS6BFC1_9SPHN|nr:hypothetical protein [Sphingomonas quercus]MBU3076997.1 hypothetical protein [Sphingomonas quercus]